MAEHFWMETNSVLKKVVKRAPMRVETKALTTVQLKVVQKAPKRVETKALKRAHYLVD